MRPGTIGGANWGGATFDAGQRAARLQDHQRCEHRADRPAGPIGLPTHALRKSTRSSPATCRPRPASCPKARTPRGRPFPPLPLLKPPYGHVVAIDLNRGAIAWRVPFGDNPQLRSHPALKDVALPDQLGSAGAAGVLGTAGGLVFVGGNDIAFHALDVAERTHVVADAAPATRDRHADDLPLARRRPVRARVDEHRRRCLVDGVCAAGLQVRLRPMIARLIALGAFLVMHVVVQGDDWPEWRGAGRTGVWNETGILETFPAGGLTIRWRTPIHAGYAGPSVSGGRVFLTDSRRTVGNRALERALALDERTGAVRWTQEWQADYTGLQLIYAIGPRATPTVDGNRVYVLGAMGRLLALDAATGQILWQKDFVRDFDASVPSWGMSSAPLVDGERLIALVGGEPNAKVIAFNKHTGEEVWRALSSDWEPGYNQPTIITHAGVRQLIIWHPRAISSLDPVTGKIYWEVPSEVEMGMTVATPVHSGSHLLVTSFYNGARLLKLDAGQPGASLLWAGKSNSEVATDAIHSTISTPVIEGDYIYGVDSHGELRCLELATGKRVWESMALVKERARWATAFFVKNGDRYFINNDRGELVIAKLSPRASMRSAAPS